MKKIYFLNVSATYFANLKKALKAPEQWNEMKLKLTSKAFKIQKDFFRYSFLFFLFPVNRMSV